jgi:DNA-binding PadR family transcriptional regulator
MSPVFRHGRLRLYLLRLLDEEPRHGYEVIRLLRDRFMGIYAPSPGTIYPRLARLEEEGLVTHDEENGRKVYRITEAGREELRKRGAELDELEAELSASVNDIVREVREDVRETVRTLREELTWAARDMRRGEREARDEAREQARQARETAWAEAKATREQGRQAREQARETARDTKEQAKAAREEALRHAQRIREEAASLRHDALGRFRAMYEQVIGDRDPWAEGTGEDAPPRGPREHGPDAHDDHEREHRGSEHEHSGSERDSGPEHGHGHVHGPHEHGHDWSEWFGWADWTRWGDWPGRKNWPGPRDMAAFCDLEHLAKDFASDFRKVAWDSGALGGDVMGTLRDILQETLDRIKTEVFGEPGSAAGAPADSETAASSEKTADSSSAPSAPNGDNRS